MKAINRRDFLSCLASLPMANIFRVLTPIFGTASAIGFASTQDIVSAIKTEQSKLQAACNAIISRVQRSQNLSIEEASAAFSELKRLGDSMNISFARRGSRRNPSVMPMEVNGQVFSEELWAFDSYAEFVKIEGEYLTEYNTPAIIKLIQPKQGSGGSANYQGIGPRGVLILVAKVLGSFLSVSQSMLSAVLDMIRDVILGNNFLELLGNYIQSKLWDKIKDLLITIIVAIVIHKRGAVINYLARRVGRWVAGVWVASLVARSASIAGWIVAIAQLVVSLIQQRNAILG